MAYTDNYDNITKDNEAAGNAKAAQYSQQQSQRTMPRTPPMAGTAVPPAMPPPMNPYMPQRTAAGTQPPVSDQTPMTVQNQYYLPAYLTNFIGKDVRVEFLIGTTGPLVDRIGTLLEIGASYIVLRPIRTNDLLTCDLYSIKFVTIYGASGNLSTTY